jgi:hypothetical protein
MEHITYLTVLVEVYFDVMVDLLSWSQSHPLW